MRTVGLLNPLKRTISFEHVYYCRRYLSVLPSEKSTDVLQSSLGDASILPLEYRKETAEISNKKLRIVINTTHDKLRDQWRTIKDPDLIWAQHISNRDELERYAAAVIRREERFRNKEIMNQKPTPTEWCYKALQKYFRGGGKEERRDLEHQKVARLMPHLLPSHCISNSDAAAMQSRETSDGITEELRRSETARIEKVSVADSRSAQPMQEGKKRMEKRILTEEDSGATTKSASERISSDEALTRCVDDTVDPEMISLSKDAPKSDSLHNNSHQDNFIVKDITSDIDSISAKKSVATAPFAVNSTKDHELCSVWSCASSPETGSTEKQSDGTLEYSVPSPTQSPGGTDEGTFQTSDPRLAGVSPRLRVLDVGSCYNPFKVFSDLDVVALDLQPATTDTFQCDFLKLTITEPNEAISETASSLPGVNDVPGEGAAPAAKGSPSSRKILSLPSNSFDAVIFSSLLSYLPCPELRLLCCKQAYRLIKPEGVLVVAELDPRGKGKFGYFFETWYIALAFLGFSRVKHEQLSKFHGMLFRKEQYPEAYQLIAEQKREKMYRRKFDIVSQNTESETLNLRHQQIKEFDLDKALTGLWLWHNLTDVRQEEVTGIYANRKSVKTSALPSKSKLASQIKRILTWYIRSFSDKMKLWIRKIM